MNNNSRKCPERMRTILQAMERSIDAARRSRMKLPGEEMEPTFQPKPAPAPATSRSVPPDYPLPNQVAAPRLKARPKRLDVPFIDPFQQPSYRSQTG